MGSGITSIGNSPSNFNNSYNNSSESSNMTSTLFCHSCLRRIVPSSTPDSTVCENCGSAFVQSYHSLHQRSISHEARRLASTALMLRMLESRIRDDINVMNVLNELALTAPTELPKLSASFYSKLRYIHPTEEMLIIEPTCSLCLESFDQSIKVLQMPCSHICHKECVLPWLRSKYTCPICRYEITDTLPTITEIAKYSYEEIAEKLTELQNNESNTATNTATATAVTVVDSTIADDNSVATVPTTSKLSKEELAQLLIDKIIEINKSNPAPNPVSNPVPISRLSNNIRSETPMMSIWTNSPRGDIESMWRMFNIGSTDNMSDRYPMYIPSPIRTYVIRPTNHFPTVPLLEIINDSSPENLSRDSVDST